MGYFRKKYKAQKYKAKGKVIAITRGISRRAWDEMLAATYNGREIQTGSSQMTERKIIPIVAASEASESGSSCSGAEPFALMVLGDSMMPEFEDGDVVVVEPEGLAHDGSFVIAFHNEEYIFRQLRIQEGRYSLIALNESYPAMDVPGMDVVKGVVIQKSKPGKRKLSKSYI
jgi:SOS-response transcriptional repressor LexA